MILLSFNSLSEVQQVLDGKKEDFVVKVVSVAELEHLAKSSPIFSYVGTCLCHGPFAFDADCFVVFLHVTGVRRQSHQPVT